MSPRLKNNSELDSLVPPSSLRSPRRQHFMTQKSERSVLGSTSLVAVRPSMRLPQCFSLGSGMFSQGQISFTPSEAGSLRSRRTVSKDNLSVSSTIATNGEDEDDLSKKSDKALTSSTHKTYKKRMMSSLKETRKSIQSALHVPSVFSFHRSTSTFMRTSDLDMDDCEDIPSQLHIVNLPDQNHTSSNGHEHEHELTAHYHHPSQKAPPGVQHDPNENWVALDTGKSDGIIVPIAPVAVEALARRGILYATNSSMWTPDKKTDKLLKKMGPNWHGWQLNGPVSLDHIPLHAPEENDVLVWTGSFAHKFYGSDIPSIRAEGIVNMSPEALFELLLDSSRVNEYNKSSLGREELMVLQDDHTTTGPFGKSVTKIVRSSNKPPLLRRILQFQTLLHGKELDCRSGYVLVSRAVTRGEEAGVKVDSSVIRSEILTGVNVILRVKDQPNRCIMITVNHLRSPVPMMVAKKIGMSSAVGFFGDIRALC